MPNRIFELLSKTGNVDKKQTPPPNYLSSCLSLIPHLWWRHSGIIGFVWFDIIDGSLWICKNIILCGLQSWDLQAERRVLDFSECGTPAKSVEKGKCDGAEGLSSPSSCLLKSYR